MGKQSLEQRVTKLENVIYNPFIADVGDEVEVILKRWWDGASNPECEYHGMRGIVKKVRRDKLPQYLVHFPDENKEEWFSSCSKDSKYSYKHCNQIKPVD